MKNKIFQFLALITIAPVSLFAQRPEVEMADVFREDGKIYVVVAVISIILLGIAAYLVHLDRKISKLEKKD